MTIPFRASRACMMAAAVFAIAGCGPDNVTAPESQPKRPATPSANIENLTNAPILYTQTSLSNVLVAPRSAGAPTFVGDDFVVPADSVWTITAFVVSGYMLKGPIAFSIHADDGNGRPGATLPNAEYSVTSPVSDLNACGCTGVNARPLTDYLLPLPNALTLPGGTYWLAVQTGLEGDVLVFQWQQHTPYVGNAVRHWGLEGNTAWVSPNRAIDNSFVVFGSAQSTQTITFLPVAPNPAPVGGTATLSATASSKLDVSFSSLTPNVCTVSDGTVSYEHPGTCTVAADQGGNAAYTPAVQATLDITVEKIAQKIVFNSSPAAPAFLKGTYTPTVTGGASGNPVVVFAGPPNVCTLNGGTVRLVGVGVCTVAANQAGNETYADAVLANQIVKVDYRFDGFGAPWQNGVVNTAKAGQSIALKWRLSDVAGAAVTTVASARLRVRELNCTSAIVGKQIADQSIAGSALQNFRDGSYQYDWKSPSNYARSCEVLELDLGEGSGPRVLRFWFSK